LWLHKGFWDIKPSYEDKYSFKYPNMFDKTKTLHKNNFKYYKIWNYYTSSVPKIIGNEMIS